MRLATKGHDEHDTPPWLARPRKFRWALTADRWCLELADEVLIPGNEKWHHGIRYVAVTVNRHFALGAQHLYYDGPHCSWSFGYLHLAWSTGNCRKCQGES